MPYTGLYGIAAVINDIKYELEDGYSSVFINQQLGLKRVFEAFSL